MKKIKKCLVILNCIRTFPVYLCVLTSKQKSLVYLDVKRWLNVDRECFSNTFLSLNWFLSTKKEFRNLLLHRLLNPSRSYSAYFHYLVTRLLWKPLDSLYILTHETGGGIYIQHGFSTIIAASKIGENCWVNQQVTIGHNGMDAPVLENNVHICCGAKIIGNVTMHSNSIAGAGAIVVHDVPENAVVVSPAAQIIKYR